MRAALAILAFIALIPTAAAAGFNSGPAVPPGEPPELTSNQVFGVHPYDDLLAPSQTLVTSQYPGYMYSGETRLFCSDDEGNPFPGIAASSPDCFAYDNSADPSPSMITFPAFFAVDAWDANFVSLDGSMVTVTAYDSANNLVDSNSCLTPATFTLNVNCGVNNAGGAAITKIELWVNQDMVGWDDATYHINSTPIPELTSVLLVAAGALVAGVVVLRRRN